ncbi:MAG TPA: methyltransferase domain-containing protein [Verrucomicrobiae bacterium]|nr:methyltransferase domain-containing protein [Verrucomicrobiae bacterium]
MTSAATRKGETKWNAADYAANSVVQQTWARELIARLNLRGDERVLDVGCGDGKVSAEIAQAVPHGSVVGLDASRPMIRFARVSFPASEIRNLQFRVMDARHIRFERPFDLVFSNAALHWVDDHRAFLRGVAACLRSGGRLLVSCGGKGNAHDVFVALRPELRLKRWREFFRRIPKPYFFHSPDNYEKWLPQFGFKTISVRLVPKDAVYEGQDKFVAWLRTTWLPYVQRVPEKVARASRPSVPSETKCRTGETPVPLNPREEFIAAVAARYLAKHPPDAEGKVRVRMVRLEIEAETI